MGDRLLAGKLSQYVTSHRGQLSLAIPPWVGAMSTSLGWEGNRRFGVALAMRHRHSGLSTYGLNGLWKGDEHPAYAPSQYGPPLPLRYTLNDANFVDDRCPVTLHSVLLVDSVYRYWTFGVLTSFMSPTSPITHLSRRLSTPYWK